MQKLTVTFIYGKDDSRKLKYRLTGDVPVGVMLEKLISFQFIIDSADPKTFNVIHKGVQIEDLSKTFEECEIIDGDEVYLIPTVFEPIPPLPENDTPVKKPVPKVSDNKSDLDESEHRTQNSHHRQSNRHSGPSHSGYQKRTGSGNQQRRSSDFARPEKKSSQPHTQKPAQQPNVNQGEKKDAPIPFKPHSRNYHRNHGRKPGSTPNKSN